MGPRERQVRGLVTHDPAKLRDRGPVHEDPDPVRGVGGKATLEPVSKPESRRAVDCFDEGHERLGDRELDARLAERRQCRLDVRLGRERGADAVGLHVDAAGAHLLELGKQLAADRERPVGGGNAQLRDGDPGLHPIRVPCRRAVRHPVRITRIPTSP